MLPDETVPDALLSSINAQYPCRVPQLLQRRRRPEPTVNNRPRPRGDRQVADRAGVPGGRGVPLRMGAVQRVGVTARHLTQRVAAAVGGGEEAGRCDGVGALAVMLAAMWLAVVVVIPNLTVIFIVSVSKARLLSSAEVPHIHFTPYTKDESIKVLSNSPPPPPPSPATTTTSGEASASAETETEDEEEDEYTPETAAEELYVWEKFCGTVWDSLAKAPRRDIVAIPRRRGVHVGPVCAAHRARPVWDEETSRSCICCRRMFRRESSI
ncbi:uncharacterized protein H6S33_009799, partial [Morchella sextelata]|uniref:uncharacterized protein n=1 Tax=Morchella sextelata TaxID=1174677 RepID=UPI001D043786